MIDLLAAGSWAIFDHIILLPKLPQKGETINILSSVFELDKLLWGGCSFNVAVAASKLGVKTGVLAVEGEDFISQGYKEYLENLDIDISGVIILPNERSGHGFLLIDQDGNSIVLGNLGAALQQGVQSPSEVLIKGCKGLVVSPTFDEFTLNACKIGKENNVLVAVNGSLTTWPDIAPLFINTIDILFCNQFEIDTLISLLRLRNIKDLFDFGLSAIFVTLGADGCKVINKYTNKVIPAAKPDKFVDQTGAGDAFVGAAMSSLLKGYDFETSAKIGNIVGSYVVEKRGAQTNLPDWSLMLERYIRYYGDFPSI
ncbi:MAG TPA: PfkB family carbohydrate kinase [Brevefilum sp.]|nr:PfkB family carbohydrate kinase [Brevefilum sp.]HOR18808.1 PfkB family carbohydrate kinase [Brevefilum sp.]HPL68708.1 PfkB family carbohydrate kinase [Brevefilum sp.]